MEESFGGSVGKPRRRIRTPFRAVHTLFAASGARARVTSGGGREEGDINFCRNRRLYASLLRHPRFDGCSFVVRSLNAGAGKERSIFNLRLHAKREKRGNRQTMRFVTVRARTHTTANNNRRGTSLSLSLSLAAAITLEIPPERDEQKSVVVCRFRIAPLTVRFMLFDNGALPTFWRGLNSAIY